MDSVKLNRRRFLTSGAAIGAGAAVVATGVSEPAEARMFSGGEPFVPRSSDAPEPITSPNFLYLTPAEVAFVGAAAERLIPADELGPGALQCNVPLFIDHQLAGAYGSGQHWYMQGPWAKGTDTQGFQSRLPPAALYRAAIKAIEAHVHSTQNGKTFADLPGDAQDKILSDLESGSLKLEGVDAKTFFTMLLINTKEGMFSDPIYGGNTGMGGWKMLGFPGARYNYLDWVGKHGQRCNLPPVGLKGRPAWTQQD